jgi:hypothetical protein
MDTPTTTTEAERIACVALTAAALARDPSYSDRTPAQVVLDAIEGVADLSDDEVRESLAAAFGRKCDSCPAFATSQCGGGATAQGFACTPCRTEADRIAGESGDPIAWVALK